MSVLILLYRSSSDGVDSGPITLSGTGSLSSSAAQVHLSSASAAGLGSLSATPTLVQLTDALLSGSGLLPPLSVNLVALAESDFAATGFLLASAQVVSPEIGSSGKRLEWKPLWPVPSTHEGSADLSATGTLTCEGTHKWSKERIERDDEEILIAALLSL
jgi:hypothetical protein